MKSDLRVAVPLPNGQWLLLAEDVFQQALAAGAAFSAPATAPVVSGGVQPLVDSAEMARLVGVHSTTVEAMASRGEIPSVRAGRALRFDPRAVLEILAARPGDSVSPARVQAHELNGQKRRSNQRSTDPIGVRS